MKKIGNRKSEIGNLPAFTLVELLVVIAIIGILAAMLMPALTSAIQSGKRGQAKTEMASLVTAIQSYYQDYGRFPTTQNPGNDFTYGGTFQTPATPYAVGVGNNAEVIAILMDNTTAAGGVNTNHQKNLKQVKYLTAKLVSSSTQSGVCASDYVYRDPWGNPYVITLDLNFDGVCQDAFYQLVSGGSLPGTVMVWSAGPDGKIDPTKAANIDPNKDNVLSWK